MFSEYLIFEMGTKVRERKRRVGEREGENVRRKRKEEKCGTLFFFFLFFIKINPVMPSEYDFFQSLL